MSQVILDCKGLACPGPVLECKSSIESSSPDSLTVVVDNQAARENVSRFLASRGYEISAESRESGTWTLEAVRSGDPSGTGTLGEPGTACPPAEAIQHEERTTVFITSETIGIGDDTLGAGLMKNFLATLPELGSDLWRIVLVNGGVRLACRDHPCLEGLKEIAASGTNILVCGTCLDFFDLLDRKEVGDTTNMLDVVTSLQTAAKIINI